MTGLRDELERLGETAPVAVVPDDTWGRAQRTRRRDRALVLAAAAAFVAVVAGGLAWLPAFWATSPLVVLLIALGGVFYTVGALVYGRKWPNPSPAWFGFHEIFHALTVAAFVTHYVAVSMTVYGAAS